MEAAAPALHLIPSDTGTDATSTRPLGLLFEADDGRVRLTDLGEATRRWLPILTPKNAILLARHAAYALSACQLVNPTGAGGRYDADLRVFPFQFIWRAMLALGGRISSDELNRAMFKVRDTRRARERQST